MSGLVKDLGQSVLAMPRPLKRLTVLALDVNLCVLSVWLAYYLRLGEFINPLSKIYWVNGIIKASLTSIGLAIPIFVAAGLYRAIFRYSGLPALRAVGQSMVVYTVMYASVFVLYGVQNVPRTVGLIQPILLMLMVVASRALARVWLGGEYESILKRSARPKSLIYGAGSSGRQLATAISQSTELQVLGFLDDDETLHGHQINGLPVYRPSDFAHVCRLLGIRDVLLAMPNIGRKRRNEILQQMQAAHVQYRSVPSMTDLAKGRVSISELRELDIDDLLGREAVAPNRALLTKNIVNKTVLVTGAGGSIGSELCRQILAVGPARLLLIEQSEFALYAIHQELEKSISSHQAVLVPLLASVQDGARMQEIMSTWRPDTVYHAAAYKHVPLVEHNPAAGIKNNVFGTVRTAKIGRAHV